MGWIALEFQHENGALAANGTDVLMLLDGRWSNATRVSAIWRRVEELRSGPRGSAYQKQLFVGFTRMGESYGGRPVQVNMSDPGPLPHWA